jgi:hypothetical protein
MSPLLPENIPGIGFSLANGRGLLKLHPPIASDIITNHKEHALKLTKFFSL